MDKAKGRIEGFSLIELLIAMTVTLIIGGAIVGLLVSANNSFRREPEVAERQQNVRAAMDMIMRDVANAGAGAPSFVQAFTRGLNGAGWSAGPFGATDELEILSNPNGMDSQSACDIAGGSGNLRLFPDTTDIGEGDEVMVLMKDGTYSLRPVKDVKEDAGKPGECADKNGKAIRLNCGPGGFDGEPGNVPVGVHPDPYAVISVRRVRYRIRVPADDPDLPRLERVTYGSAGENVQVVARGIEDLQVTYRPASDIIADPTGVGGFDTQPVKVALPGVANGSQTLTVEVEVQLSARTQHGNLQGAARATAGAAADTAAIRGRLVSRGAPRAALFALASQTDGLWR